MVLGGFLCDGFTGLLCFVLWGFGSSPASALGPLIYALTHCLLQLMAEEAGLTVDLAGFQKAMEDAKELSRASESLFSTAFF